MKNCNNPLKSILLASILFFLWGGSLFSQSNLDDLSRIYPETAGIYELKIEGQNPVLMQVFFKNGTLRAIENGEAEPALFTKTAGDLPRFEKTSLNKGTYIITFEKDASGKYTNFSFQNDKQKLKGTAKRISAIDDSKADPASPSDRQGYIERNYIKKEVYIPMRDGVKLLTQIYMPVNNSEPNPIILFRQPYGNAPYGESMTNMTIPSLLFFKENYIIVYQDIRGRSMSEGEFNYIAPFIKEKQNNSQTDESSDAYDTVDWLIKNIQNNNGKVGIWGISYAGFTAAMGAVESHPAVKAVSPQAPMSDLFRGDDGHHNGAFYLNHYLSYLYYIGQEREAPSGNPAPRYSYPVNNSYAFLLKLGTLKNIGDYIFKGMNKLWNEAMEHEAYDSFWQERSVYKHLNNIKPSILTVGGWYDAEDLLGTLETYKNIESKNKGTQNTIVMGPWRHSKWNYLGGLSENMGPFAITGTIPYFQEKIEFPFFNYYLKNKGELEIPEAAVYDTGTDKWKHYSSWPPAGAKEEKLYFGMNGALTFKLETDNLEILYDEYLSDPSKPVPYTNSISSSYNGFYFVEDQRFASTRPDVLVYTSDILTEDITVTGPVKPELYVSTSGTDADWVVKLIDVYPENEPNTRNTPSNIKMGGYQRLVRGDILRGKFRNSLEKPEPFNPGEITKIEFELPDVEHTFKKGHKIMIQIQSSWFPLFDRNPQKFCNIRLAEEKDFQKAMHKIYRSKTYPSGVKLKIIKE